MCDIDCAPKVKGSECFPFHCSLLIIGAQWRHRIRTILFAGRFSLSRSLVCWDGVSTVMQKPKWTRFCIVNSRGAEKAVVSYERAERAMVTTLVSRYRRFFQITIAQLTTVVEKIGNNAIDRLIFSSSSLAAPRAFRHLQLHLLLHQQCKYNMSI